MTSVQPHPTPARRLTGDERGSAVILALLMMVMMMLLGGAVLVTSLTEASIAANQVRATRAFHLAEAGIEHARKVMPDQDVAQLLQNGGALFNGRNLGLGTYSVQVRNNTGGGFPAGPIPRDPGSSTDDTDGYLILASTGTVADTQRTVEVAVKRVSTPWAGTGLYGAAIVSASAPRCAEPDRHSASCARSPRSGSPSSICSAGASRVPRSSSTTRWE